MSKNQFDESAEYRSPSFLNRELVRQLSRLSDSSGGTVDNGPVIAKLDEVKGALGQNRATFTALKDEQKATREAIGALSAQQADEAKRNDASLATLKAELAKNDADTQTRIDAMKVRISASVDSLRTEQAARDAELTEATRQVVASVDGLEAQTASVLGALNRIADSVDGVEAAQASAAQQMVTLLGHVDALESQNAALLAAVQALPATINAVARPDLFESRVRSGAQTVYNTGLQVVAVAGNLRFSITNPTGSGKLVLLDRIIMGHTSTAAITGEMRFGPSLTGTPLATLAVLAGKNMRAGLASDSPLLIRSDFNASTALAGGTGTPVAFVLAPSARTTLNDNLLAIPPGVEMGINLKFAGAASAVLQMIVHTEPV